MAGVQVEVRQGDITRVEAEAITNAANDRLKLGGGVAGAIQDAGGSAIQQECDAYVTEHGPVPTGAAVCTGAGLLPYKAIIHAVGPVWQQGQDNEALLGRTVRSVLECAEQRALATVAIPAVSSGIFGFPKDRCAIVFYGTIREYCNERQGNEASPSRLKRIILINIDKLTVLPTQASIFAETFRTGVQVKRSSRASSKGCCSLS